MIAAARRRLAMLLWVASVSGAACVTVTVLPQLGAGMELPAPTWVLVLAGTVQNGLLLALAVWVGTALTPSVGFRAPVFEAVAARRPVRSEIWPQLRPGIVFGVPCGFLLAFFTRTSPPAIARLAERFEPPILARILYGGMTEEVLMRWGVMTGLTWVVWRLRRRPGEPVRPAHVCVAIAVSSLLFGLGHLPAARYLLGEFTPGTLSWVIGANTSFGLVFGWLYWRRGLEAAMIAHALTHLVNFLTVRF